MNKKELIDFIKRRTYTSSPIGEKRLNIDPEYLAKLIHELDKPEKQVVPVFVAEWYEEHKDNLNNALYRIIFNRGEKTNEQRLISSFEEWLVINKGSLLIIADMRHGYEVEEEPKWIIKDENLFLKSYTIYDNGTKDNNWVAWGHGAIEFEDEKEAEAVALLVDGKAEEK